MSIRVALVACVVLVCPVASAAEAPSSTAIERARAALPPALAARLVVEAPRAIDVTLPARLGEPVRVAAHGVSLEASLVAASADTTSLEGARVAELAGATWIAHTTADGAEEWFHFERAPRDEKLAYALAVDAAGLRFVSGQLELLDASGAPRLRMLPPFVVGSDGVRSAVSVRVEGCAFDADARAPWGRAVTPPGAARCTLVLDWSSRGVRYPAIVDPAWTATTSATIARQDHAALLVAGNKVLVASGMSDSGDAKLAELFDVASATWAATGALANAAYRPGATVLADGRALIVNDKDAARWDPSTGTWTMSTPATSHTDGTLTPLGDGTALAVGGGAVAEIYTPSTNSWAKTASLTVPRSEHVAVLLGDGRVLVAGGYSGSATPQWISAAEIYDPTARTWTTAPPMTNARALGFGVALPDGRALVGGGYDQLVAKMSAFHPSVEIFDPKTNTWSHAGDMSTARWESVAVRLTNGAVLAAGGYPTDCCPTSSAELFDAATNKWTTTQKMITSRVAHRLVALADGRALVTGGYSGAKQLAEAEIFDPSASTNPGDAGPDGGPSGDGAVTSDGGGAPGASDSGGGCGCATAGGGESPRALAALVVAALLATRRRRSSETSAARRG